MPVAQGRVKIILCTSTGPLNEGLSPRTSSQSAGAGRARYYDNTFSASGTCQNHAERPRRQAPGVHSSWAHPHHGGALLRPSRPQPPAPRNSSTPSVRAGWSAPRSGFAGRAAPAVFRASLKTSEASPQQQMLIRQP